MSSQSWGPITLPEIRTLSSLHGKNGKTGFWTIFYHGQKDPWRDNESSVPVKEMLKIVLLPCHVTRGGPS